VKLITWNTQWCRGLDGVVSPERIVAHARELADFDVLCLQEIASGFDDMPGAPGDQPAQLQALLPGFQVFFGAAVDEFEAQGQRQRFGNLIATRLPVASVQHHPLPWPADAGVPSMPRMCSVVTLKDPTLGPLRVMTTHLAYYSSRQRMAQAQALRELHRQACTQVDAPPLAESGSTPFRAKVHTSQAILCGDFNLQPQTAEYIAIQERFWSVAQADIAQSAIKKRSEGWLDAWALTQGRKPHAPTFRLFDRQYGPEPVACDFVFVSHSLAPQVKSLRVDGQTQASDHQPVVVELG
jgi:endonuclease/exonuclease/phosphatase family metal-dependent hydrolase